MGAYLSVLSCNKTLVINFFLFQNANLLFVFLQVLSTGDLVNEVHKNTINFTETSRLVNEYFSEIANAISLKKRTVLLKLREVHSAAENSAKDCEKRLTSLRGVSSIIRRSVLD